MYSGFWIVMDLVMGPGQKIFDPGLVGSIFVAQVGSSIFG